MNHSFWETLAVHEEARNYLLENGRFEKITGVRWHKVPIENHPVLGTFVIPVIARMPGNKYWTLSIKDYKNCVETFRSGTSIYPLLVEHTGHPKYILEFDPEIVGKQYTPSGPYTGYSDHYKLNPYNPDGVKPIRMDLVEFRFMVVSGRRPKLHEMID